MTAMSQYIPRMRQYPLELWFPEERYTFDRAQEVAKRYEEQYGVQYYCQLLGDWIYCRALDSYDTFSSDDSNDRSDVKHTAKSFKDFVMGL